MTGYDCVSNDAPLKALLQGSKTGRRHNDGSTIYYYLGKVTKSQETYFAKRNIDITYDNCTKYH